MDEELTKLLDNIRLLIQTTENTELTNVMLKGLLDGVYTKAFELGHADGFSKGINQGIKLAPEIYRLN